MPPAYSLHNAKVRGALKIAKARAAFATMLLLPICAFAQPSPVAPALSQALQGTQASAVVLDLHTGVVLASSGPPRRGTPGSTLKPLLLEYALDHNLVQPQMQVFCRRDLHIAGRALPCTHPPDQPVFTAETALAESCNTWFAELARRFPAPALASALDELHLQHAALRNATVEQRQLAVLGISSVSTSPLELAQAYRNLLQHMPPSGVVARGLQGSVDYGMANPAAVKGVTILGKTGTASDPGEAWTHGWFAGALPGRIVVVIYVPHGDGGTAARLAQRFFQAIAHDERSQ